MLHHLFWTHLVNLTNAYTEILNDKNPCEENAWWKIILNLEFDSIRIFLNAVAEAVSKNEIPVNEAQQIAFNVQKRIMPPKMVEQAVKEDFLY